MAKRVKIAVIDPSAIIRFGVIALLQQTQIPNVEIVEFQDTPSLLSGGGRCAPEVVIINASTLGLYTLSQFKNDIGVEGVKIIALQSVFIEEGRLGGYDEVISIYDSVESIKEKIHNVVSMDSDENNQKELSQREREIIVCVVKGLTNKQIADSLCISTHTVIAHRRNIANKLQIHSPSGLTIFAIVNKLVDLADIKNSISK